MKKNSVSNIQIVRVAVLFVAVVLLLAPNKLQAQNCTVNAGIDQTVCANSSVTLQGNVGGFYIDTTVQWTFVSGPVTPTIGNPNSLSTNVSGLTTTGTYVFSLNTDCNIATASDQVNVIVQAGASAVTPSGSFSGCYTPGTPINLTGVTPAGHTLRWTATSSVGTKGTFNGSNAESFIGNSPTVQFPPLPNGYCSPSSILHTITVTSTNIATGCKVSRTRNLYFRYDLGAVTAYVPPACGACQTLIGTCEQNGSGTWSILSEPIGSSATIANPNNSRTSICNMINGSYTVVWTVSGGSGCVVGADTVTFVATGPGTVTPAVANSLYFCDSIPNTATLTGNTTLVTESVKWIQISGSPVTIDNDTMPVTTVSGLNAAGAPYIFVYNTYNGVGCNSYDTMQIVVKPGLTIGNDVNRCNSSNILSTRRDLGGSYVPAFASDSLQVTIRYESGPMDSIGVNFHFANKIGNQPPGSGGNADNKCPQLLSKGSNYTWVWKDNEIWKNTSITHSTLAMSILARYNGSASCPAFPTLGCERIKDGQYKFEISIYNGCTTYTKIVRWGFRADATVTSGTDQMLPCGFDSTTLAGVSNRFPDCNWQPFWNTISTPAGASNPIDSNNMFDLNAPLDSLLDGKYLFQLTGDPGGGTSSSCDFEIDTVQITVSSVPPGTPTVSGGGGSPYCVNTPISLNATVDSLTGLGTWSIVSTTPAGGTGSFSPSINSQNVIFTPSTPSTTYNIRWTAANGCGTAYDSITVSTNSSTAILPAISANACNVGGNVSSLTATPAGGTWTNNNPNYVLNTPTATNPGVNPTFISGSRGAVTFFYTLDNTASGGCGIIRDSVTYIASNALSVSADDYCNISTYPFSFPVYFNNVTPYTTYNLFASGPNSPTLSKSTITKTGTTYQKDTLLLTVNGPGSYSFGTGSRTWDGCTQIDSRFSIIEVSDPAPLAIAGNDTVLCNTNTLTLNGQPSTLPPGTSGIWSIHSINSGAPPTFDNSDIPNATVTMGAGTDLVLKWQTFGSNSDCGSTSYDLMRITYYPISNAGSDTTLCIFAPDTTTSYNLGANNPIPANGHWSMLSEPAGSNASILDSSLNNTSIIGLKTGIYILRWTIDSGNCTTTDDIVLSVSNSCIPLPINLSNFVVRERSCKPVLSWEVSEMINFRQFNILKNTNGQYDKIGVVYPTAASTYQFVDAAASAGYHQYLLEMIDHDNAKSFSKTISITTDCNKQTKDVLAYPNPTSDKVNVLFNLDQKDLITIYVRNLTGQVLYQKSVEISVGGQQVEIDLSTFAKGTYILECKGEKLHPTTLKINKMDS